MFPESNSIPASVCLFPWSDIFPSLMTLITPTYAESEGLPTPSPVSNAHSTLPWSVVHSIPNFLLQLVQGLPTWPKSVQSEPNSENLNVLLEKSSLFCPIWSANYEADIKLELPGPPHGDGLWSHLRLRKVVLRWRETEVNDITWDPGSSSALKTHSWLSFQWNESLPPLLPFFKAILSWASTISN